MRSGVTKSATRLGAAAGAAVVEMELVIAFTSLRRDLARSLKLGLGRH